MSVVTAANREALLRRAGLQAVAQWEKEHGRFTPEEMEDARRSVQAQLSYSGAKLPAGAILTSDPEDIKRLLSASGHNAEALVISV